MTAEDLRLRGVVATQLDELMQQGGELSVASSRATYCLYGQSVARARFWKTAIHDYLQRQRNVACDGRALVVTAGPPASGKTTAIELHYSEFADWRLIDADILKELLLQQAVSDEIYSDILSRRLADGGLIKPLELATLVHRESVELAGALRRQCMRRGENLIVQGTLSWHGMVDRHLAEVTEFEYAELKVLSVAAPIEVALERSLQRWWDGRRDPTTDLGGRFTPSSAIRRNYGPAGQDLCLENAAALVQEAQNRPGLAVEHLMAPDASIRNPSKSTSGGNTDAQRE